MLMKSFKTEITTKIKDGKFFGRININNNGEEIDFNTTNEKEFFDEIERLSEELPAKVLLHNYLLLDDE